MLGIKHVNIRHPTRSSSSFHTNVDKYRFLFISGIWPEKLSTAAGVRSWNLVEIILGAGISYISPGRPNDYMKQLRSLGIETKQFQPNDPDLATFIDNFKPNIVIMDRFSIEEQFGAILREKIPDCALILDTQDLHFLRHSRHQALEEGKSIEDIKNIVPHANFSYLQRELASIHRSDHVFLVSEFERNFLVNEYGVPSHKLSLAPFFYKSSERPATLQSWEKRKDFFMIGNYYHKPNRDQLKWTVHDLWPKIRSQLGVDVKLNVYGAYPDQEIYNYSKPEDGVIIKGFVKDHLSVLMKHRINFAPLRFGAGIKGKISDGMFVGTPCVTTPIGAEGMWLHDSSPPKFAGVVASSPDQLVAKAVELYNNKEEWQTAQQVGFSTIASLFDYEKNANNVLQNILETTKNLKDLRATNFVGEILWYNQHRSNEFMAKFHALKKKIKEEKNKLN